MVFEFLKRKTAYTDTLAEKYQGGAETIEISMEQKLIEFRTFYEQHGIPLTEGFEFSMKGIWTRNAREIHKAIRNKGFNDILLIPGNLSLPELHAKMTDTYAPTLEGVNFREGGSFAPAKSVDTDKHRIVLVHKLQNLQQNPKLYKLFLVPPNSVKLKEALTLEDYLIFQRIYFEETQKHLDTLGQNWVATMSGGRLVYCVWKNGKLEVNACDLDFKNYSSTGVRPTQSFYEK